MPLNRALLTLRAEEKELSKADSNEAFLEEILNHLRLIYEMAKQMDTSHVSIHGREHDERYRNSFLKWVGNAAKNLQGASSEKLTTSQKRKIKIWVYNRLPKAMDKLQGKLSKTSWYLPAQSCQVTFQKADAYFSKVVYKQSEMREILSKPGKAGKVAKDLKVIETPKAVTFPDLRIAHTTIGPAIKDLKNAWNQANHRVLSVEDRFTIEAIASSYLPESWNMCENLMGHSKEAKARSIEMFLEQVSLMQKQLDMILKKESKTIFSQMEAYTHFLQAKVEGDKPNSLSLTQK